MSAFRSTASALIKHLGEVAASDDARARKLARIALFYANEATLIHRSTWDVHARVSVIAGHLARIIDDSRDGGRLPALPATLRAEADRVHDIAVKINHAVAAQLSWLEFDGQRDLAIAISDAVIDLRRNFPLGGDGRRAASADLDFLAVAPPSLIEPGAPCVGLFGRTSCGKTTLARRFITSLSPAWARIAKWMSTSPAAHTTRTPFTLEFTPEPRGCWWAAGEAGDTGGPLDPEHGIGSEDRLRELLSGGRRAAWCHLMLPSRVRQRFILVDLPGTHGDEAGVWATTTRVVAAGMDAYVLPMDHRDFRSEEKRDLDFVWGLQPRRPFAVSLRLAPEDPGPLSQTFKRERVIPGMTARAQNERGQSQLRADVESIEFFGVGREPGDPRDQLSELAAWTLGVRARTHALPSLSDEMRDALALLRSLWSVIDDKSEAERILAE